MPAQTSFRPQLHGFDFSNSWDLDDNYRNFVWSKVNDAVPIAAEAIATNPAIGAALLAAIGAAYGIGEALAPGLFDLIAIPIIVDQIKNAVTDKINNGLPSSYGACGGMAFAPLDYYYKRWPIPKGVATRKVGGNDFDTPSSDTPESAALRNYIYKRFEDTWASGGVLDKMLQWYIVLETIPTALGGGGPEVQERCKPEWPRLAAVLDQGKPQPIALLFDTSNIFDNHQVVAYGYAGDPYSGPAFINVYDNNHPDQEVLIQFDFTRSEMRGRMTDVEGNELTTKDDRGNVVTQYAQLKGFFCATYTPETPPVSWGLTQGLTVAPTSCQSAGETFEITGVAGNALPFFDPAPQKSVIVPLVGNLLTTASVSIPASAGALASAPTALNFGTSVSLKSPGTYIEFANAQMIVLDATGDVAKDQFGLPLIALLALPPFAAGTAQSVQLSVLARLGIVAVNRSGTQCYFPFVEGSSVLLHLKANPFAGANVKYEWTAAGVQTSDPTDTTLQLIDLPVAKTSFVVGLTLTNLDTGCIATGSLSITTYDAMTAARFATFCQLSHYLSHLRIPGLIDPLGPDDPGFERTVLSRLSDIRQSAQEIVRLANLIERSHKR